MVERSRVPVHISVYSWIGYMDFFGGSQASAYDGATSVLHDLLTKVTHATSGV